MRIVVGRGNKRQVYDLPHGSVFQRDKTDEGERAIAAVTQLLRIK